jgi:hypothetical protein
MSVVLCCSIFLFPPILGGMITKVRRDGSFAAIGGMTVKARRDGPTFSLCLSFSFVASSVCRSVRTAERESKTNENLRKVKVTGDA